MKIKFPEFLNKKWLCLVLILVLIAAALFVAKNKIGLDSFLKKDVEIKEFIINPAEDLPEEKPAVEEVAVIEEEVVVDTAEEDVIELAEEKELDPNVLPEVKNINYNPNILKIGFITDLHVGSHIDASGKRVLEKHFVDRINYFVKRMNNSFVPNFILVNGDVIEGTQRTSAVGSQELGLVKDLFDQTSLKTYWTVGNHDLRAVNKSTWKSSLGINYLSTSFDVGNYKIIILDSNFTEKGNEIFPGRKYDRGSMPKKQIEFLKKELKNTEKKPIVFSHHPLLSHDDIDTKKELLKDASEIQEIFSKKDVLAAFAGHIETLFYDKIDGVKYFVSPGILKNEKYPGAYSEITINGSKMTINMSYINKQGTYTTFKVK